MPLLKKACRKCHLERGMEWHKHSDDRDWDNSIVMCWFDLNTGGTKYAVVSEKPPDHCPYRLEHTIADACDHDQSPQKKF